MAKIRGPWPRSYRVKVRRLTQDPQFEQRLSGYLGNHPCVVPNCTIRQTRDYQDGEGVFQLITVQFADVACKSNFEQLLGADQKMQVSSHYVERDAA